MRHDWLRFDPHIKMKENYCVATCQKVLQHFTLWCYCLLLFCSERAAKYCKSVLQENFGS